MDRAPCRCTPWGSWCACASCPKIRVYNFDPGPWEYLVYYYCETCGLRISQPDDVPIFECIQCFARHPHGSREITTEWKRSVGGPDYAGFCARCKPSWKAKLI